MTVMMSIMIRLMVILGSTREGRQGEKIAHWVVEQAKSLKNVDVDFVDLQSLDLPFFNRVLPPAGVMDGSYGDEKVNEWGKRVALADAFLIITPEYNHSYPAVLKNAIDHVYYEWHKKPVSFVGYGVNGAARSIEHLRGVFGNTQTADLTEALYLSLFSLPFDQEGKMNDESYNNKLSGVFTQLLWWGNALKDARLKS